MDSSSLHNSVEAALRRANVSPEGEWDSLSRLNAVMAVETEFNVVFTTGQVCAVHGLTDLVNVLRGAIPADTPKKCVVVDLDGTLWDGVLGENNISVSGHRTEFQSMLKKLHSDGWLLAIASKNEPTDAERAVKETPGMVLGWDDFASVRIGWHAKPTYLIEIARELGFSTGSLIFIDDSPHERSLVRQSLQDVCVLEMPADPASYVSYMEQCGAFTRGPLTFEDIRRNIMTKEDADRKLLQVGYDHETYLQTLNQRATIETLSWDNVERAAQLCQRANQYHFTLSRHTPSTLAKCVARGGVGVVMKVVDRFGDAGRVGLFVAYPAGENVWALDTLVMSCRVIGRGLETALIAAGCQAVAAAGGREVRGVYVPGPRNGVCLQSLERLGVVESGAFRVDVFAPPPVPSYITSG